MPKNRFCEHRAGENRAMQVKLIVVGGKANRTEVQLRLPAVLGRSRDADLTLGHSSISRRHCRLWEEQGQVMVEDLQSTNGTFVEDQRVDRAVLEPGARLRLGPLTFVVVYDRPRGETPTTVQVGEDVFADEPDAQAEEESILLASEPVSPEAPESITPAEPAGSEAEPVLSPSAPKPADAESPLQAAPPAAEQTEGEEPPEATPPVSEQAEAEAPPPVAEQATMESDSAAVSPQESPPVENPVEELSRELAEENQEDEALRRFLEELQ